MCVPACKQKIARDLGRRGFLRAAAGVAATLGAAACVPSAQLVQVATTTILPAAGLQSFSHVVDLTHTLTTDFPTFGGEQQLEIDQLMTLASDGYNLSVWLLNEHTGTHMDAPFHFSDGPSADQIPVQNLIGPLAVIDIRSKAEADPDAQLTPDDIAAWEASYGPLPDGAIVAMLSGWDEHVRTEKFRNADDQGGMHFPGFHIEAIEMLLGERNAVGIFVDTLSLDYGQSADFAVHYRWLPANKWGIECVANLGQMPASGATVVVGGPKIAGATGGPTRIFGFM
ncbi:MAG: cyclase family protein [Caldilineaceae bacterium]|nr:cyclase family protein [Caldilineaceae bacterium]